MDVLTIRRGITRYSSDEWSVRMFVAARGHDLRRDLAPELKHAGLLLPFGIGLAAPVLIDRYMPLFEDGGELPETRKQGGLFMTSADDSFSTADLETISKLIYGGLDVAPSRLQEAADRFTNVLADAYHSDGKRKAG